MAARNKLENKRARREQREENRRVQERKRLAARVEDASFRSIINEVRAAQQQELES